MRTIEWTSQFKRDYKREGKGQYRITLDVDISRSKRLIIYRYSKSLR